MRILIVSDAWVPQINGVVRTYQRMCEELMARGHAVAVIGPDRFRTIPCPSYPEIRLAVDAWYKLGPMMAAFKPDAVHVATEGPLGQAARRWRRQQGAPFTTSFHTRFPDYLKARTRIPAAWTYRWVRRFHAPAHRVLVPTQSMCETLRGHGFENLHLWGRGVDTALFRPVTATEDRDFLGLKRPIFACVGRVAVEKNIRAFLDLDLPGSKLIVGDGPQRAELAKKYPDARFVGAKIGADLARHYQAADVFVFPSKTDTFGLVLVEALACGVPVAAYPETGPLDVIGNADVGRLDADLGRAARAALTLSRSACRAHALTYSWDRSVDQFLEGLTSARIEKQAA